MNVLVTPEDFRKDQYILKPIITAMLDALGRSARVEVCQDPLLGGVEQALNWHRIRDIIEQYARAHSDSKEAYFFLLSGNADSWMTLVRGARS